MMVESHAKECEYYDAPRLLTLLPVLVRADKIGKESY
jgi:hypothetical protein